jgi:hypothetical protein
MKKIIRIIIKNAAVYAFFFGCIGFALTKKWHGALSIFHSQLNGGVLFDALSTVIFVVIAFTAYLLFLGIIGAGIAFQKDRYFSNAEIRKIILYLFSIIPPIIVSKYLIQSYASASLAFVTIYMTASFSINMLLTKVLGYYLCGIIKRKIAFTAISLGLETALFTLLAIIMRFNVFGVIDALPRFNLDDLKSFTGWYARLLFVIAFNWINYSSVEYIISVFSTEMKKPHVKYYFLYQRHAAPRFLYLAGISLSMVLRKIRLYLAWFVSLIILFEMDNSIFASAGYRIKDQADRDSLDQGDIFSILIILYGMFLCINTIIDVLIYLFDEKSSDGRVPAWHENKKPSRPVRVVRKLQFLNNFRLKTRFHKALARETARHALEPAGGPRMSIVKGAMKSLGRHKIRYGAALALVLAVLLTAAAYSKQYVFLQHYDFYTGQKFTNAYVLDELWLDRVNEESVNGALLESPVCLKKKGILFTHYRIAEFAFVLYDKTTSKMAPVLETPAANPGMAYPYLSFIQNGGEKLFSDKNSLLNHAVLDAIGYNYTVSVPNIFADIYLPFSLERNGSASEPVSSNKLLFPALVCYVFYFLLTVLLVLAVVCLTYSILIAIKLRGMNSNSLEPKNKLRGCMRKLTLLIPESLKLFIISTPFVLIIAFSPVFFPQGSIRSGFSTMSASIVSTGSGFVDSILVYLLFGCILLFYLLPGIAGDLHNYIVKILTSKEIHYLNAIGMEKNRLKRIITVKYGRNKILQIGIESLLFILVLRFFIMYCYLLPQFIDVTGISTVLSIENTASKVYRAQIGFQPIVLFHYALLLALYGIIYWFAKKLKRED